MGTGYCGQEGLDELFRGKMAKYFLRVIDVLWERGEREASAVAAMLERHGVPPGSRLLELGAGNGRVALRLARLGYHVVGVEYSPILLEDGFRRVKEAGLLGQVDLRLGDAYRLDETVGDTVFDAVYTVWTTMIGYGVGEECDQLLLRQAWRHTRPGGLFVVAYTASYDIAAARQSVYSGDVEFLSVEAGDLLVYERPRLDPARGVMVNRWSFYRRHGRSLEHLGEAVFALRLYTLHELVKLAGSVGWQLLAAYDDPLRGTPYRPCRSSLNLVFQKSRTQVGGLGLPRQRPDSLRENGG